MILMAMGQEKSTELLLVLDQVGHIRHHQIHAIHIILREAQSAVYYDHVTAVLQHGDIFSDLIESAKGYDF